MADSIILNKCASIERCLERILEDYEGFEHAFLEEQMRQDAILLNLQRACELTIDLSNHLIKVNNLTVPAESRQAIQILADAQIFDVELADALKLMVAFRNIAVRQYQELDLDIVVEIITQHLGIFKQVVKRALSFA